MNKEINKNIGWTYAICTKCKKLYTFFDKNGEYNDDFPRIMCPNCKTKAKRIKAEKTRKEGSPDTFLKTNNITDKDIIKEFKKIYNRNTRRQYKSILKDAIEIVGYKRINNS